MKRTICLWALSVALSVLPAAAQEGGALTQDFLDAHHDAGIQRIDYVGDFKMRRAKLETLTGLHAGATLGSVDIEAAEQRLRKSGLFSTIVFEGSLEPGGLVLTITLVEKMTLFPLPIASFSNGPTKLGLILYEADFLGTGTTAVGGGIWSSHGLLGIFQYKDSSFAGKDLGLTFLTTAGAERKTGSFMDGASFLVLDQQDVKIGTTLSFRNKEVFRPLVRATLEFAKPDSSLADAGLVRDYSYAVAGAGFLVEALHSEGWYNRGFQASASYDHGFSLASGRGYDMGQLGFSFTAETFAGAIATIGGSAAYGNQGILLDDSLKGPGYRTLPYGESLSSKHGAAYANLELPFARPRWAVLTLCAYYEAGLYETGLDTDTRREMFQGPGLGFRLYLKNVAIPALGVDFAYNVPARAAVFSVVIGIGP